MAAVEGFDPAKSGQQPADSTGNRIPAGVWGDTTTGIGVFGSSGPLPPGATDIVSDPAGVEGHGLGVPGVLGRSDVDAGVVGESLQSLGVLGRSEQASGVLGVTFSDADGGGRGVFGSSTTGGDGVVGFVGGATGVIGSSIRGDGVLGISGTANGVVGENFSESGDPMDPRPAGVAGRSRLGDGVSGSSTAGSGVFGLNDGAHAGVWGSNCSNDPGIGVKGTSLAGTGVSAVSLIGSGLIAESVTGNGVEGSSSRGVGVLGSSLGGGFAGLFLGRVRITGTLSKGGGGFEIDHPLEPETKYLSHSFVESPDMLNVYSGTVTTDDTGRATVSLPDYFEALNEGFRYQLTVIGQFAQAIVEKEVRENQFVIATDSPRVTVSWQVTGIRRDPWAVAHRIRVETEKTADEVGRYLHPDVADRPDSARLHPDPADREPPAHGGQAELARVRALLPQEQDERVEQMLQTIRGGGAIDRDALRALIAECLRHANISPRPPRTTRRDLERDWERVEATVRAIGHERGSA
jgi:hypothetical protein